MIGYLESSRAAAARRRSTRRSRRGVDGRPRERLPGPRRSRRAGLVQRVDFGDGIARYEPLRAGDHHHHLVCDGCGKVDTFHDAPLERAIDAIEKQTGYHVTSHDVVLRGACSDCRAKSAA